VEERGRSRRFPVRFSSLFGKSAAFRGGRVGKKGAKKPPQKITAAFCHKEEIKCPFRVKRQQPQPQLLPE